MYICVVHLCMCRPPLWLCTDEWRVRDRLWLDWCPSPDESEIVMCQQGWIMHALSLLLLLRPFSTSCLQSFVCLFITTATSEDIHSSLSHSFPPSSSSVKRGHGFPFAAALAVLWSTPLSSAPTSNSFFSNWIRYFTSAQEIDLNISKLFR